MNVIWFLRLMLVNGIFVTGILGTMCAIHRFFILMVGMWYIAYCLLHTLIKAEYFLWKSRQINANLLALKDELLAELGPVETATFTSEGGLRNQ